MKRPYYILGFLFAIVLCGAIFGVLYGKAYKEGKEKRYDEMQMIARQKAAMHGFILLMVCNILGGIVVELHWLGGFDTMMLCMLFAVTVFGCECVLRNAYFRVGESGRPWMASTGAVAVMNYAAVASHVLDGSFPDSVVNLGCALGMTALFVTVLIQRRRNLREAEAE